MKPGPPTSRAVHRWSEHGPRSIKSAWARWRSTCLRQQSRLRPSPLAVRRIVGVATDWVRADRGAVRLSTHRTVAMVDELRPSFAFITDFAAQARAVDHETSCHVRALRTADATDCSADRSGNVPKSGP